MKSTAKNLSSLPAFLIFACIAAILTLLSSLEVQAERTMVQQSLCTGLYMVQSYTKPDVMDGNWDTVTHLWSTVGGVPTVVVAHHANLSNAEFDFNCTMVTSLTPGGFSFKNQPDSIFASSLLLVFEFDDSNQEAMYDGTNTVFSFVNMSTIEWNDFKPSPQSDSSYIRMSAVSTNEKFQFLPSALDSQQRNDFPPQELLPSTASIINLVVSNYTFANSSANSSAKLAMQVAFIDGNRPNPPPPSYGGTLKMTSASSINDEYTPTIFHQIEVKTSPVNNSMSVSMPGYAFWKPVCYMDPSRTVDNSFFVRSLNNDFTSNSLKMADIPPSLITIMLYNSIQDARVANISFGTPEDQTYNPDYLLWEYIVGLGEIPEDQFSTAIILLIVFGFGLPVLALIIGSVFIVIKRCRTPSKSGYTTIQ